MPTYYIVLDLEMNPTSRTLRCQCNDLKRETIEIGAVKIDAVTNTVVGEYTCVIRPQLNHQVEPYITKLTGITTKEVRNAPTFGQAFADFMAWVGDSPVGVYSWSDTDFMQLIDECEAKGIHFPDQFVDWTDFQKEYPKYLGYSEDRCFNLRDAAKLLGVRGKSGKAHRALYDAQVTAQLVLYAQTGEYEKYKGRIEVNVDRSRDTMTYSIGDACGGKLAALLARMRVEQERGAWEPAVCGR